MSDEKHDKDVPVHNVFYHESGSVPMRMHLLSTWEVRKVPANCVSRLCTLTVTRLEVIRPLDTGHGSIVLSTSMKTPHRVLRSNEINLPSNGILNIPLQLTFSLQYPHFLKRGGNELQIRLQRRKRVRNRPLGGYKTLAIGKVEMSQVLQHSFQGEVKLYAEKVSEQHVAVVTVGSLTSTLGDMESRSHMAEVSSDEDEDDIFSDDLVERGSDSESGDNEQPSSHDGKFKRFKPPSTAAVLRLLRLNRPSKHRRHPEVELLGEEEGEEYRATSVAFVSSPSESEEEEDEIGVAPPKPTLSPFFGSDRCSMVSLPTSAKSAEAMTKHQAGLSQTSTPESPHTNLKRYNSLEEAIETERIITSIESHKEWDLLRGRVWCIAGGLPASQLVVSGLQREGEVSITVEGEKDAIRTLSSLINSVLRQWKEKHPFSIVLVGNDNLVSSALQALVSSKCAPEQLRFAIIPTAPGLMSARLANIDEQYQSTFPIGGNWISALEDSVDSLLQYVQDASHSLPLHLAQAVLHTPVGESGGSSFHEWHLPFMCSVSVGGLEEPDSSLASGLPLSPTSGSTSTSGEPQELVLEYWSPKGQKTHHDSVKVRSAIISCAHQVLNVTATKDKKGKSIRKRKPKESDSGGSIVSLTATQLVCRPGTKGECVTAVVDGVEREGVSLVKLSAVWEQTQIKTFGIAITSALEQR